MPISGLATSNLDETLKRCCSSSVTRVIQVRDIKAYAELTGQGFIEGLVNLYELIKPLEFSLTSFK